jgi:phosphoglycolate phosphatase
MGHPIWDMEEVKRRVALSLKDAFPALFGDRWSEAREIFYARFDAVHLSYLKPLPGAEAILQRLYDAGIPLGVVSNKSGPFIRKESDHLGWTPLFRKVLGAGDASRDKPAIEPVTMVLDSMGLKADPQIWFIGDAGVDMECAVNAGLRPILLRHDAWTEEEFQNHPPLNRFQSWPEFGGFLDEILFP